MVESNAVDSEPATEPGFVGFRVSTDLLTRGKTTQKLVTTDLLKVQVQSLGSGGETNLHAHRNEDAFWLVLSGRARFYSSHADVAGEYGRLEGVVIRRGQPYWFESCGDEGLVVIRVAAKAQNEQAGRIDFEARKLDVQRQVETAGAVLDGDGTADGASAI